jgi:hypothetical protein
MIGIATTTTIEIMIGTTATIGIVTMIAISIANLRAAT